ncbi:MAG: DUF503 domain-containing protein [Dehalococcoidia bacterium]
MHVAVCQLSLRLPASNSLKDKRQVVKSVIARVQNQFNVSIAEVEDNEAWRTAGLGLACVSNNAAHANRMIETVVEFIERTRPDVEIVDCETEVLTV